MARQQTQQVGPFDLRLWLEVITLHIAQQTMIELAPLGIFAGALQVAHADQQAAASDGKLEDQAQAVVALDVVNHLYDGPVLARQIVEDDASTPVLPTW